MKAFIFWDIEVCHDNKPYFKYTDCLFLDLAFMSSDYILKLL